VTAFEFRVVVLFASISHLNHIYPTLVAFLINFIPLYALDIEAESSPSKVISALLFIAPFPL
jgi:hypothetical protein